MAKKKKEEETGPKKVVCSICGKEVTKRSTYYIGTNSKNEVIRACKIHKNTDIENNNRKFHERNKVKQIVKIKEKV